MTTVKLEVYEDQKGEWRWRLLAKNKKIIADSGEGYAKSGNATRAARSLIKLMLLPPELVIIRA